jgi:cell division protein FtsB
MRVPRDDAASGRQRVLDLARAVTPPRFLRLYQERATFRRRVQRALVWSFVPVLVWAFVFADGGLLSIAIRRVRVHRLLRQVAELERREAMLHRSIERRESDPAVLERLARERYGMARPGEKVYRIVEVSDDEARRVDRARRKLEREGAAAVDPPSAGRDAATAHGETTARDQPKARSRARRSAADPDDAGHARRF